VDHARRRRPPLTPIVSPGRKSLRVGSVARIHSMDPRQARDLVSTLVVQQIFETAYAVPRGEGAAPPVLFTGPLVDEGIGRHSAAVRAGVSFSDGTPLTAALIAASLNKVEAMREQARIEAAGDRVSFTLLKPNPRFDLALTLNHAAIVLEKEGQQLGTGAFIPAPGSTVEAVRLFRNPHYRARPALDEITLTVYPSNEDGRPEALIRAVENGEVDFTTSLSRTDAGEVKGVRKAFQPSNSTASLYFNTERPELRSAEVRRALALAIDRVAVTEVSYSNALAFAATSLLPPMMGTYRDGISADVAKAKAQFAQAPLPHPKRLRMLTVWAPRPYLPHPRPVAETIARQLSVLGIEVDIVTPRNNDEFFRGCERGDYDMVLGGWIADTPDPADFLESNLHSAHIQSASASRGVGHINLARFRSPAMDEALRLFRANPTPENRVGVLQIVAREVPLLPLMYGPTVVVSAWRVKNVDVSPLGVPHFENFDIEA
jgi:ABC-type transport system substrate-binding protein